MKNYKKHLSLLLAIAMLVSLVVVNTAITVSASHGDLLVDLDFSTFTEETSTDPNNTNASIGTVTNNGTLASTTRVVMSALPRYHGQTLKLDEMWNANGEKTYWLNQTTNSNFMTDPNRFRMIDEPALETQANTISIWVKYDPLEQTRHTGTRYSILDYTVDNTTVLNLITDTTNAGNFILRDGYKNTWRTTVQNAGEAAWGNIVITNPAYDNGTKVMSTYFNGVKLGDTTITKPATNGDSVRLIIGGMNPYENGIIWPETISFGELKVYDDVLTSSEIAGLYTDNAYKFVEGEEPLADSVTGYSFTGDTVDYDEQSHNILVTAGQGATEDVTITYTCGGEAFTGATEPGVYNITATVSKENYNPQVLNATLTINAITLPTKLVDLDYSTYVQNTLTTPDGTASIGNVTNTGSLASTTKVVMSSLSRYNVNNLICDTFVNENDTDTPYLHFAQTSSFCLDPNIYRYVDESALETRANTISVWIKYDPTIEVGSQYPRSILDYTVDYDGSQEHLFELVKSRDSAREDNKFILKSRWYVPANEKADITDDATGKWVNFVITNPEYTTNDGGATYTKTMTAYMDGTELFSKTITKPAGTLSSAKIAIAGQNPRGYNGQDHSISWPEDIAIGDIDVYDGVLTSSQIAQVRRNDRSKYTERAFTPGSAEKLIEFDLTNFAKTTTAGSGGIVNTGSSNSAVITAYTGAATSAGVAPLSVDYLYDPSDLSVVKKIMRLHHENYKTTAGLYADRMRVNFQVEDNSLASQAFTLSFWVNVDTVSKQTSGSLPIVQYQINRSGGDPAYTYARLWQYSNDISNTYQWTVGYGDANHITPIGNSREWHHVAMVVPEFTNDSSAVKFYIDGVYKPTLDQELDLAGYNATKARIMFANTPQQYSTPGDISYGDIAVYSTALIAQDIEQIYNSQKSAYYDCAYNKITATNSNSQKIRSLTDLADNAVVTFSYDENITPGTQIFVASYTSDEQLLTANTTVAAGTGSLTLTIPEAASRVRVFTLKDGYIPIIKVADFFR